MMLQADQIQTFLMLYLGKILSAIALWIAGGWGVKFLVGICRRSLFKGGMQAGLVSYFIPLLASHPEFSCCWPFLVFLGFKPLALQHYLQVPAWL
jgi:hypothetical protein